MTTATDNSPPLNHVETIKLEIELEQPNASPLDWCSCCLAFKQSLMPEMDIHVDVMWNVFKIQLIRTGLQKRVICEECVQSLEEAASFKHRVLNAQHRLSGMIQAQAADSKATKVTIKLERLDSDSDHHLQDAAMKASDIKSSELTGVPPPKQDASQKAEQKPKRACPRKAQPATAKKIPCKKRKKNQDQERLSKRNAEIEERSKIRESTLTLIGNSNLTLFRWYKNKYGCFCCKETFLDHELLRSHSKMHNTGEISKVINRYNQKYYYKAEVTSLLCNNCGMNADSLKSLLKHLISDHNIKFQIEDTLLIAYKLSDEFYCQVCNEKFKSFICLDRHMNVHYNNYVCDVCGKGFRSKTGLSNHAARHDGSKKFQCKPCNLTFVNFYRKRQHVIKHHNCTVGHVCPHCGDKFNSYYNRLFHLIKAHGHKKPEFRCDTCDKCFHNKALLKRHILKVHLQQRRVKCDLCDRGFFHPSELTRHIADIHGTRDFKCTHCSKAFMQKRHLNNHLAIHIEALRHVCTFCNKTFAQKSNMKSHMKTHLKKAEEREAAEQF